MLTSSRVWCKRCLCLQPLATFAKNRQNDAIYWMERDAKLGDNKILNKLICNNCTGAPKLELRCTGCNKIRARDHFSSAQRIAPDTARCRKCVSEIENVRPGQQEQEYEQEDSDEEYLMVRIYHQHLLQDVADVVEQSMGGSVISSHASSSGGVSLPPSNGFEPVPSTTRSSHLPTNTMPSGTSTTGRSTSTAISTVEPPRHEVGAGGFIKIPKVSILYFPCTIVMADSKQGHRLVPVPDLDPKEENVFNDEDDWEM
jgi:hypothetical protein